MRDDFTIIIQGPLNDISISNIENYLKFGHVVISSWKENLNSYFDDKLKYFKNDISIILHTLGHDYDEKGNQLPDSIWHDLHARYGLLYRTNEKGEREADFQNIAKQVSSTLMGLQETKTKFSIKTRSDESFSNLSPICDLLIKNEDKLITNDFWCMNHGYHYGPEYYHCFHPSDHIVASNTKLLLKAFQLARQKLINENFHIKGDNRFITDKNGINIYICPESLIGISFLESKEIEPDAKKSIDIMEQNVIIVDTNTLGKIKMYFRGANIETVNECHSFIHNISQLRERSHHFKE
jgi:hypothetical protein